MSVGGDKNAPETVWFFLFRVHQLFGAKLGLLGAEEDDGFLVAFLLKVNPPDVSACC